MNRKNMTIVVVAAVLLLLAGAGILFYGMSQQQGGAIVETTATPSFSIPDVNITPSESLEEVAAQIRKDYPELADLLLNPELGTVYKDFYLAYTQGGEKTAIALARQRNILNDKDEVEISLVLDTEDSSTLIAELETEAIIVKGSFRNKINIAIPLALIKEQIEAEEPDLILQRLSNFDHVIRLELPNKAKTKQGTILGQGVNVTLASSWHAQGITGKGVKVGILDLGFGGYRDLLGTELPDNVTLESFGDTARLDEVVHGTACAEVVHEMAPDAELYLAYYDGTDVGMGLAVEWLIEQGVDIISNSTGSNGLSPMDGTGFSAELVDWANSEGILWVNAAGNEAQDHYRGSFRDSDGDNIHDFSPNVEVLPFIPFGPGYDTQIILSWNDWANSSQDYDFVLLDKDGNQLAKSEESQDGQNGQYPIESFIYEFDDDNIYLLAIENYNGEANGNAIFDIFISGGEIHPDYVTPEYSISSPADAKGAFAVGAVHWADDELEPYSSQGPTADGRIKPDIAAPSVIDSASYVDEAFNGTSAAAPHVSGAAALVMQAFPDFSPDEVGAFLQERSIDLGVTGTDNIFGAGRLNLGASPDLSAPPSPDELPILAPVVDAQPTSTPRPAPGGEIITGADVGVAVGAVSMIVIIGACMICLGGGAIFALIIGAITMVFRK